MHTSLQPLGECHCWWTRVSPRAHVAKFYVRLQLIRSVLRASNFSVEIYCNCNFVDLLHDIPFGFSFFWYFCDISFQLLNYFVWLRVTDEGSVPKKHIWSILLMKSDINGVYILVSFYISTTSLTWLVSLLVDQRVPEGTCSQVLRPTSVIRSVSRASTFSVLKFIEIVIFVGLFTIPFGFSLFWHFCDISSTF